MNHHRNWLPQNNSAGLRTNFDKTSRYLIEDPVQPHVSWSDSSRPGILLCSQPAVRNRCHSRQLSAARQYIDYCNYANNASLAAHQATCCLHRSSDVRPVSRSQLTARKTDIKTVKMTGAEYLEIPVVNEETLIEALQTAGTGAYADSCSCTSTNYILQPTIEPHINNFQNLRPSSRAAKELARPRSRHDSVRRWVELREDNQGRVIDVMLIPPTNSQSHWTAKSRPATCRPQCGLSDSDISDANQAISRTDDLKVVNDAARQALLAIYQAGKPDNKFHARAPNTAALESMLAALSTGVTSPSIGQLTDSVHGTGRLLDQRPLRCQHVSCTRSGDSSHACRRVEVIPHSRTKSDIIMNETETNPVKVNLECAPNTDTVINLRVRSVPA